MLRTNFANGVNISLATKKDSIQIAKIHKEEIDQEFLSQLGVKFLSLLYESMISSTNAFVVIAKNNNKIVGFISGADNTKKFGHYFYKKYFIKTFFILVPKLLQFSTLKKILETARYSKKAEYESRNSDKIEKKELPSAELLVIAVKKEFHGRKIAQKMFDFFVNEMKNRKIKQFKVVVGENLLRAIGFYKKMGFKFYSSVSVHKNKPSKVYIYNIKSG